MAEFSLIKEHLPDYWTHPEISEYEVQITAVNGSTLTLAEPFPFFIEGGGQPDDRVVTILPGFSKPVPVNKILSNYDFSLQLPKKKTLNLNIPCTVKLVLDVKFRLSIMRAHTCQHLLSALILKHSDIKTLKAVMQDDQGSLTIDKPLPPLEVPKIISLMNSFILTDPVTVTSHVLEAGSSIDQEGRNIDLTQIRGTVPAEAPFIRVLAIGDDVDLNTCGGTHVASTNQILSFFLTSTKKNEISFICGFKALSFLSKLNSDLIESNVTANQPYDKIVPFLGNQFSSLQKQVYDYSLFSVNSLRSFFLSLYQQIKQAEFTAADFSLNSSDIKDTFQYHSWFSNDLVVLFSKCPVDKKTVVEACKIIGSFEIPFVLFTLALEDSLIISVNELGQDKTTARSLANSIKESFSNCKGGGNEFLAQVMVKDIDQPFETIEEYIKTIFH